MAPKEISAFDAKTHLSELLRETERGKSFLIRRRGKPVARLVPVEAEQPKMSLDEVFDRMEKLRSRIKRKIGTVNVRELINEGRRF